MKAAGRSRKSEVRSRMTVAYGSDFLLAAFCCLLFFSGCAKRDPQAAGREALQTLRAKLQGCARESQPVPGVRLVVVSFAREAGETRVQLVAYNPADKPATGEDTGAIDFDVPTYLMSRGRWLINESGRAYLIDERCREYRLKDRRLTMRQAEAKNGRLRLGPGEACEVTLSFPPLLQDAQAVALVYGTQVLALPFPLSPQ